MKLLVLGITFLFGVYNCAALNSLSTSSESLNSVSTSLNSISTALNSVSSVSKSLASISTSSGSEDDKKSSRYLKDVETLTHLFLAGKVYSWETNMQDLAFAYGYLSWRENPLTFIGIGQGLQKASLPEKDFQNFLATLSRGNPTILALIEKGYRGAN